MKSPIVFCISHYNSQPLIIYNKQTNNFHALVALILMLALHQRQCSRPLFTAFSIHTHEGIKNCKQLEWDIVNTALENAGVDQIAHTITS